MRESQLYGNANPYIGAYYFQDSIKLLEVISGEDILTHCEQTHMHDEIEMILVTAGSGWLRVNGVDMPLKAGSLCWLMPFHVHMLSAAPKSKLCYYYCRYSLAMLLYLKTNKNNTNISLSILEYMPPHLQLDSAEYQKTAVFFRELLDENEAREFDYELLVYASILRLISLFERKSASRVGQAKQNARPLGWNALQYLQFHFNKDIDSASVAEVLGVSASQVNGALRLLTGKNFHQNLNDVRIRNACAMMQFEELTITYIGNFAGYKSASSFYRQFKERKGITPDEFRKNLARLDSDGISSMTDSTFAIICYVAENYRDNITAEAAAKALYLSKATIAGMLEKNLHCTFTRLLHFIRLWVAAGLLLGSKIPACDIAIAVGFNSVRTFTRCFTEEFGTSPDAFRKSGLRESR